MTLSPSIAIASGLWLAFASPAALADPAGKLGKSDAFIVVPDLPSKPTTIAEPAHPAFLVLVRYPATISSEAANILSQLSLRIRAPGGQHVEVPATSK